MCLGIAGIERQRFFVIFDRLLDARIARLVPIKPTLEVRVIRLSVRRAGEDDGP